MTWPLKEQGIKFIYQYDKKDLIDAYFFTFHELY